MLPHQSTSRSSGITKVLSLVLAAALLAACSSQAVAPTPTSAPTASPSAVPSATSTPLPTATPRPTATPTLPPTATPTPAPTQTAVPTVTATSISGPALADAQAYVDRAVDYMDQGDYERAIADFNQAIQLEPDFVLAYVFRGAAFTRLGEYDLAFKDLDQAIQLNPNSAIAYSYRGTTYDYLGEYDLAIADQDKAIELEPTYVEAYNERGIAYADKGDYERALADYSKAIELNPDYVEAYFNRGLAYSYNNNLDRAITAFGQVIKLAPNVASGYLYRGFAYYSKGNYDRAIADLDQAIRLDPSRAAAYFYRGDSYRLKQQPAQAVADYQKALDLTDDPQLRQQAQAALDKLGASAASADNTLKIAILAPLSGLVPSFGISVRDGALMAIDEWNAKGGVLGKKIEAVIEDSRCEADASRDAANKVIDQDGVHYIIGEVCSKASIPISDVAEAKHVVQISPTSTNPLVTLTIDGVTKQYAFRACFIDQFQGTVMAKFALSKGYKTAFVMLDEGNDYVRGLAEYFVAAFQKGGGQIVGQETYNGSTDTDFSAILAKVAAAKPDVLYVPDYYPIVNLVGQQAKEKGITAVMMGGDGWDSADLDVAAADNSFYSNHYDVGDTRAVMKTWIAAYGKKYQQNGKPAVPDALATLGYDATNLMLTAIQAAGVDDPAKVKTALAGIKFQGVTGVLTFDAQHNPVKSAVIVQVKDGKKTFAGNVNP